MNSASERPVRNPLRFRALGFVLLIGMGLYLFVYRHFYYDPPDRERSRAEHQWFDRGFTLATVWPPHANNSLLEGVKLALWELDTRAPGVCGSNLEPPGLFDYGALAGKIRLLEYVEASDGGAVARDIVSRSDVLAVIGHELPGTALAASLTYQKHGVIFLAPKMTDHRLTNHEFRYVFRLVPNDGGVATSLAAFAKRNNWTRVGVIFGRTDHGKGASDQFLTAARQAGITLAFSYSYFHDPENSAMQQDFRNSIGDLQKMDFDAIMLADDFPWAAKLLLDLRQMGVTQPVMTTDKLDTRRLLERLKEWERDAQVDGKAPENSAAHNLYVASAVDPASTRLEYRYFRDRFRAYWGQVSPKEHPLEKGNEPGYGSSQGYEAACLFIKAVLKTRSADPVVVATTLKAYSWPGLFGDYTFDTNGDIVGRSISIKAVDNYEFVSLPPRVDTTEESRQ